MVGETNGTTKVISPSKLAHIVLKTSQYDKMRDFYVTFLGGKVVMGGPALTFISYDDEHHRIALINMPDLTTTAKPATAGMHHVAFTFDSLPELLEAYQQRKSVGINPSWCVNHGPTTSIYYADPDGNYIETQVDNFEDPDEATKFMSGEDFQENPIGVDFVPEDLLQKIKTGTPIEELLIRPKIGPRGVHDNVPIA